MRLLIQGKCYDLVPHNEEPAWLVVPSSEIPDFQALGLPLIESKEGVTVLVKSDLLKRLSQIF
jgi:hypothetical protein